MKQVVDTQSSFALIIGIGKYKDPRIPTLKFSHADAHAVYETLAHAERAGFRKENMKMLLDEGATLLNIKKSISNWLFQNTNDESTVVIYFAGHGGTETDKTRVENDGIAKYLLPWDCDSDDLFASGLSSTDFNRLLSTIKARRMIYFMDACYAGGVTQKGARDIGISDGPAQKLAQGEGRIVIASAKPNQRSWEDEKLGHGIFTYHLLEALSGKADIDNDGYVSIMEVFKYLEKNVPDSVRKIANSLQEPLLVGDISRDIYLTANMNRINELKKELEWKQAELQLLTKEKLRKLFQVYEEGKLTSDVYLEAMKILETAVDKLAPGQHKLLKNLDALLKGGLDADTYLENRLAILASDTPAEPRAPASSQKKFCTNCGSPLQAEQKFCTRCGKKT
jgi:uncharacterized caspase-like protein